MMPGFSFVFVCGGRVALSLLYIKVAEVIRILVALSTLFLIHVSLPSVDAFVNGCALCMINLEQLKLSFNLFTW
jgi:hypothetical protein